MALPLIYAVVALLLVQFSLCSPTSATALSAREDVKAAAEAKLSALGLNYTLGHVGRSVDGLETRADPPPECNFYLGPDTYSYSYIQITGLPSGQSACVAWVPYPNCGENEEWGDPDFTDIQNAMIQQVAKDGLFKTTDVGRWTAAFVLPTSAFANRDTSEFSLGLVFINERALEYYYSRDGDRATVSSVTCP